MNRAAKRRRKDIHNKNLISKYAHTHTPIPNTGHRWQKKQHQWHRQERSRQRVPLHHAPTSLCLSVRVPLIHVPAPQSHPFPSLSLSRPPPPSHHFPVSLSLARGDRRPVRDNRRLDPLPLHLVHEGQSLPELPRVAAGSYGRVVRHLVRGHAPPFHLLGLGLDLDLENARRSIDMRT